MNFAPLSDIEIILLVLTVVSAVLGIIIGLRPLSITAGLPLPILKGTGHDGEPVDEHADASAPMVSVIVYAFTNLEYIADFLKQLLKQKYPNFEVIVVFSASAEATAVLSEDLVAASNLYVTFIPPGSHNLSRRKLALTVGMKAAKGEVALLTASNCTVPSDYWIAEMAAPFRDRKIELCLGYSRQDISEIPKANRLYRQMNNVLTTCSWIAAASKDRTYRGDGLNIAFRRQVFFEHKGFAKSLNLHLGDDDLFVYEIARPGNTALCISPESTLTSHWGSQASRTMSLLKEQYDFTRRWLPKGPFLRAGFASTTQWITLLAGAAAIAVGIPNMVSVICVALILMAFWTIETVIYRKAAIRLRAQKLCFSVPLFMLWRPVGNLIFRLRHRSERYNHFTWNRHQKQGGFLRLLRRGHRKQLLQD